MINILYVFDENYAPHAGISMLSALKNNPEETFCFYCAGMNVSEENIRKINAIVKHYKQKIIWVNTENAIKFINCCDTGYWNGSKATWLKVFVLWELPKELDKILYLDSDTIVLGGLTEINKVKLGNHPTAQAYDAMGNTFGSKRLGLKEYYNAGIILFNLKYWRQEGLKNNFINHLKKNVHRYMDNEQGLLNDYFRGQILRLPLKFNKQGFLDLYTERVYLSVYNDFPFYSEKEIIGAKRRPIIQHFFRIFGDYPWEKGNNHPMTPLYEKYRSISPWRGIKEKKIKFSAVFFTEKMLYKILPSKVFLVLFRKIVEWKI